MNSCASARLAAATISSWLASRPAVADVVAHRAVKQRGVLGDHADVVAQALLGDVADVLTVDQDASALQVVEAQQQIDQRRLAGARAADQPHPLARA